MKDKTKDQTEYLRRNLEVAKAFGVISYVETIERRLLFGKRPQKWLLNMLYEMKIRARSIQNELIEHRNEINPNEIR